jgi:quercetin dioxygenase-like cupin family protein
MDMKASDRGTVVFSNYKSVAEVPTSSVTENPADQGASRRLIGKAINGSPDLLVGVLRMEPGQYHPLHSHPNMGELYFVLEGSCEIRVGDRVEMCDAGTAIYTPAGIPHSIRTHQQSAAIMVTFPEGDWDAIQKVWHEDSEH